MDILRVLINNSSHCVIPVTIFVMKGERNLFFLRSFPQDPVLPPAEIQHIGVQVRCGQQVRGQPGMVPGGRLLKIGTQAPAEQFWPGKSVVQRHLRSSFLGVGRVIYHLLKPYTGQVLAKVGAGVQP